MAENSRVKFKPDTKDIEIEGSESFVTATLDKLQAMLSGAPVKKVPMQKGPKAAKTQLEKNVSTVATGTKRGALLGAVLTLISSSPEGIAVAELKEKTDLKDMQLRNIINAAIKRGKIQAIRRGVYVVAAAPAPVAKMVEKREDKPEEKIEEKAEEKTEQPQLATPNDQVTATNSPTE
ncbi:MAG: hypothetical protein WCK00_11225 [Deltaproteobacteria bacterium]